MDPNIDAWITATPLLVVGASAGEPLTLVADLAGAGK